MRVVRGRKSTHSIMANQGLGPVKIIQQGEKRLNLIEQYTMTVEQAMKSYEKGLAVTTA